MKYFAGLDVSVKETSICIVDEAGKICSECKAPSYPEDLAGALKNPKWRLERVSLEAGPLSQWLFSGLAEAGLPAICIETRHTKAFLQAQVNKSDRNDARGIAQMMQVNLFRPVHVKTLTSQKRRALLTARKLLQENAVAFENEIRGLLRNFGLKVGVVAVGKFDERIRDARRRYTGAYRNHGTVADRAAKASRVFHYAPSKITGDRSRRLHLQTVDDDPRGRACRISGVQRHHRQSRPLQELESCRSIIGIDAPTTSIWQKLSDRRRFFMRRRNDAIASLRGRASHDNPREKMVMAKGLGNERRQTTRAPKSDCRAGAPISCHHAPYVGRRLRHPLDEQGPFGGRVN